MSSLCRTRQCRAIYHAASAAKTAAVMDVSGGALVLELTMAAVSAADEGATAGMLMADAPSE
ncbi:hypothetical protein ACFRKC_37215, partial [Streptomyces chartreusis]